jgi:replication initiation and membrane attachment protein DnaB
MKISSFSDLAKSTEITNDKYVIGKTALDAAFNKLDEFRTKLSDLSDFADQLSPASKKRIFENNKDVAKINGYIDEFENKVNDLEEVLNESMDFTYINSGVLEANSPTVGKNFEANVKPFVTKINPLFTKISKTLPSFVCTSDSLIKDLPLSKKCPKGYTKTELTKPF